MLLRRCLICRYVSFKVRGPEDSDELVPYIQSLVDDTMLFSPTTKSRPLPTRLVVKKVLRNTNMMLYGKYAANRHELRDNRKGALEQAEVATRTKAMEMQDFRSKAFGGKDTSRELETDINEVYLWHGTNYEAVASIFSSDFHVGCKAHAGIFGQGLYFAESCAKADEYSHQGMHRQNWYGRPRHTSEDTIRAGSPICAMLLCRVILGRVKVNHQMGECKLVHTEHHGSALGEYDSLIGARSQHRREFILSSHDAVFPEFAVLYQRDRVMKIEQPAPPPAALATSEGTAAASPVATPQPARTQALPRQPRGTSSQWSSVLLQCPCRSE